MTWGDDGGGVKKAKKSSTYFMDSLKERGLILNGVLILTLPLKFEVFAA